MSLTSKVLFPILSIQLGLFFIFLSFQLLYFETIDLSSFSWYQNWIIFRSCRIYYRRWNS